MSGKQTLPDCIKKLSILTSEIEQLKQNELRLASLLEFNQRTNITEQAIVDFTIDSIVALTGSKCGYLYFFDEASRTLTLAALSGSTKKKCRTEEAAHYPVEQAGVWADSIRLRHAIVQNDFRNELNKRGYPDGHIKITRHMGIPIFDHGLLVAAVGVGNKAVNYTDTDLRQATFFANSMWAILKHRKAEDILKRYSMEDGLTGLANRRKFDEAIEVEWRRALRNKDYLSTILLDIDHFKAFNDTYGHQSGDECLKKVAECLKKQTRRAGELNARYGGEEFVIVLPGTPIKNALYVAESIRSTIFDMRIPHAGSSVSQFVTISAGVSSTIPVREYNSSALIRKADLELYQAKREGRNRVVGNELKHITTG